MDLHVRICGDTFKRLLAVFKPPALRYQRESTSSRLCLHQSVNLQEPQTPSGGAPEWSAPSVLSLSPTITAVRHSGSSSFVSYQQKLPKKTLQRIRSAEVLDMIQVISLRRRVGVFFLFVFGGLGGSVSELIE